MTDTNLRITRKRKSMWRKNCMFSFLTYLYRNLAFLSFWLTNFSTTVLLKSRMSLTRFFSIESIARALRQSWVIVFLRKVWILFKVGPLLFTLYMLPLGNIIRKHGVSFHCYAVDTQLYISSRPDETHQIEKLMECIVDIKNVSFLTTKFWKKQRC